jgi:hypothetical protein
MSEPWTTSRYVSGAPREKGLDINMVAKAYPGPLSSDALNAREVCRCHRHVVIEITRLT